MRELECCQKARGRTNAIACILRARLKRTAQEAVCFGCLGAQLDCFAAQLLRLLQLPTHQLPHLLIGQEIAILLAVDQPVGLSDQLAVRV